MEPWSPEAIAYANGVVLSTLAFLGWCIMWGSVICWFFGRWYENRGMYR